MDEDRDKRSNMLGASANPGESLKQKPKRGWGMEVDDDKSCDKPTIQVFQEEDTTPTKAVEFLQGQRAEIKESQNRQSRPATLTPFEIFPEEVWEQILGELEDSRDILNVFKALPDLEGRVLKNKFWWLFEQVVPHLHLRLNFSNAELLSWRLVCKRWAHGVENYLENHPCRKVVDPDRPITGQVEHPEGSREHHHYKFGLQERLGSWLNFAYYPFTHLTQFLRDMDKHPAARNPFLGRSVKFALLYDWDDNPWEYHNAAMEILQKWGRHIWFLDLDYSGDDFWQVLFDVISFVPNLKGLELRWSSNNDSEEFIEEYRRVLFPQLESLSLLSDMIKPVNFMNFLVTRSSTQIKRLRISYSEWRREYSTLFPKLRELRLDEVRYPEDLINLLTSLDAPDLFKIHLAVNLEQNHPNRSHVRVTDVVSWLKLFPSLQHFSLFIQGELESGDVVGLPGIDLVPSIKSLSIFWTKVHLLGPQFLCLFPSLEYATMYTGVGPETFKEIDPSSVYRWDVWEELPKFKEINFSPNPEEIKCRCYNRAKYEWLKKRREEPEPSLLSDDQLEECMKGFYSMTFVI